MTEICHIQDPFCIIRGTTRLTVRAANRLSISVGVIDGHDGARTLPHDVQLASSTEERGADVAAYPFDKQCRFRHTNSLVRHVDKYSSIKLYDVT